MMDKRTIVITGGASGFGKEVALRAAARGWRVLIGNRNEQKMEAAKRELAAATGNSDILTLPLDLSSLESVRTFASAVLALELPIDSFLGNAGISSTPGRTADGLDVVFETNYLGHFLLTLLLLPALKPDGKTLLVSSDMHAGLFRPMVYKPAADVARPDDAFSQSPDRYNFSKLYILYFVYELAERLQAARSGKVVNAFNPGLMHTTGLMPNKQMFTEEFLSRMKATGHLGDLEKNADIVTSLMTDDNEGRCSGVYFDRALTPGKSSDLSYELAPRKELWDLSLRLTGLREEDLSL